MRVQRKRADSMSQVEQRELDQAEFCCHHIRASPVENASAMKKHYSDRMESSSLAQTDPTWPEGFI